MLDTFFAGFDGINPILELEKADPGAGGVSEANLKHRYLWGPGYDQLLADEQITSVSSAGNTLWPLADHLGTIRQFALWLRSVSDAGTAPSLVPAYFSFRTDSSLQKTACGGSDGITCSDTD